MNANEAKTIAKTAAGLFNDLKPEQLKLLAERIVPFSVKAALTALKNHRTQHEFFTWPAFMEGIRAERERTRERKAHFEEMTIARWLAQSQNKTAEDPLSMIAIHFTQAWSAVKKDDKADMPGKQMIRRLIHGNAFLAMRQLGWSPGEARDMANECVDLNPGETIPKSSFFKPTNDVEPELPAAAIERLENSKEKDAVPA